MRLKELLFIFSFLSASLPRVALAGYTPWGWQGWLQSVPTISLAPTTGVQLGSAIEAQDTLGIYVWNGSAWVINPPSGTVTSFSFTNANGFTGVVTNPNSTPNLTLGVSFTGIAKGNGTALSAATADTDYQLPISLTTTGTSGAATFIGDVLNIPQYAGMTYTASDSIVLTGSNFTLVNDSATPAASNYYGTDSGSVLGYHALPAAVTPGGANTDVQFNNSGVFGGNGNYTTDGSGNTTQTGKMSSASASVSGLTASSIVATDISDNLTTATISSPLTYTAGALGCQASSGSQAGCLSSADWSTFNGKQAALTIGNLTDAGTDGITVTGGTGSVIGSGTSLSQHVADTTHAGYLSSADWNTFNGKGSGTVTSTSVVSANGFAGTVATATTTPAITLTTTITGLLKGAANALAAATSSDIIGLFTGCSGTMYLGADGNCHTAGSPTIPTWNGYFANGNSWGPTTTALSDWASNGTSIVLTQRQNISSFPAVSADSSNFAGVTWTTPAGAHAYLVTFNFNVQGVSSVNEPAFYISDGSNNDLNKTGGPIFTNTGVSLTAIYYQPTGGTSVEVKLRGICANTSNPGVGTAIYGSGAPLEITIMQIL